MTAKLPEAAVLLMAAGKTLAALAVVGYRSASLTLTLALTLT